MIVIAIEIVTEEGRDLEIGNVIEMNVIGILLGENGNAKVTKLQETLGILSEQKRKSKKNPDLIDIETEIVILKDLENQKPSVKQLVKRKAMMTILILIALFSSYFFLFF